MTTLDYSYSIRMRQAKRSIATRGLSPSYFVPVSLARSSITTS
jgi:hypothetical protein